MFDYISEPPSQKALKQYFIDKNIQSFPSDTINCVAYMILTIDNPDEMMNIALSHIVDKFSACRADMGFSTPTDKLYEPTFVHHSQYSQPPDCTNVSYSNQDPVFQKTWRQRTPVVCTSIHDDKIMADSRATFEAIQSESVLFQRLSLDKKTVGLTCVDFTNEQHVWLPEEIAFMSSFCETFFGPLAGISQYWHGAKSKQIIKRPSRAELAAISLSAKGMSYKQIAYELGKSTRTIENQLRNAREALNAVNQIDLIKKCTFWLDS
ncbi:MAG: hypothetical protein HRT93_02005 [Piscirickettsiaceae bacterium]|nr:hypothetical protein [Piscirickettsiaceae bacterium]